VLDWVAQHLWHASLEPGFPKADAEQDSQDAF
jgi:hypothetical protein